MKKITITYWIVTALFAFIMFGSAIPDVLSAKEAVEGFARIGMPAHLLPFIGIAKIAGVIAILVPGYPRIKEWAYAGLVFDLVGATYSIIASFHSVTGAAFMLLPLTLAALSYIFYHKKAKALAITKIKGTHAGPANRFSATNIVTEAVA